MIRYAFRIIILALGVILVNSCASKKSSILEEQVVGYWKTIVGDNEYIQFEKVDSEYVYSAFTYDRLSSSGTWALEGNELKMSYDDGLTASLKVSFSGDTMVFNGGAEKYVKANISNYAKTTVTNIGDVEILEQIAKSTDLVYSTSEPFNEDWVAPEVKWRKVTSEVILKQEGFIELADAANKISRYLVAQGFEIDPARTSEVISGYKKGNLCVLIRRRSSNEPNVGETTFVDVISGVEK
jgi:hypothetical protein